MIDALTAWKSDFTSIEATTDKDAAAKNFAAWVDGHVTNKMGVSGVFLASGQPNHGFTFNKSVFEAELKNSALTDNAATGAAQFADAWETAVLASSMLVDVGESTTVPPAPKTKWSEVACVIVPASVTAAKAVLVAGLTSATLTTSANSSAFPDKFRSAFLGLKWAVTGMDSTPSPAGPLPLVLAAASSV